RESERTSRVFATPGGPSRSAWPPHRTAIKQASTSGSRPTTARPTSSCARLASARAGSTIGCATSGAASGASSGSCMAGASPGGGWSVTPGGRRSSLPAEADPRRGQLLRRVDSLGHLVERVELQVREVLPDPARGPPDLDRADRDRVAEADLLARRGSAEAA